MNLLKMNLALKMRQGTLRKIWNAQQDEKSTPSTTKERSLQRKYFTPNYGSDSRLFPLLNNVECFICHNFGHVVARCRSRMVQDHHTEISSASRYFKGYYFSCNIFGHKAINYYRRNMKHVICYACSKFGHIARECRRKFWPPYQNEKTSSHSKIWKKKEVQLERCGIAQCTDIIDSGGDESVKLQCYKYHTQFSWRQVTYIREFEAA